MRPFTLFISSLLLCIFSTHLNAQVWYPVGPNDTDKLSITESSYSSMTISPKGDIYVAMADPLVNNYLTVRKYSSGVWSTVGMRGFNDSTVCNIGRPGIVVDKYDNIYVLYSDSSMSGRLTVAKYAGTWNYLGAKGFAKSKEVPGSAIALDTDGNVYVAYSDDSVSAKATMKKFNGTSWQIMGGKGFSAGQANYVTLAIDKKTNIPYVTYSDVSYSNKAVVMKYMGISWLNIGGTVSDSDALYENLAFDTTGLPYLVYADKKYLFNASVKKTNGSSWSYVGTRGFTSTGSGDFAITTDSIGIPYVFDAATTGGVFKFNGTNWSALGDTFSCNISRQFISFKDKKLYIGYNTDIDYEYKVKYLQGSSWINTATGGISVYNSSSSATLNIDTGNVPYIVYRLNNQLVAKKFTSGTWTDISPNIVLGVKSYYRAPFYNLAPFSFAINKVDNALYIAYKDSATRKAGVIRYNGTTWVSVGTPFISDGSVYEVALAIDPSGIPYVAYTDSVYNYKAVIKKYDGSAWSTVGAGFSMPSPYQMSMTFAGGVYISYISLNTIAIQKLSGTTWDTVAKIVGGPVRILGMPKLVADKRNNVYFAYSVEYLDSITVQKLTSTGLSVLGTPPAAFKNQCFLTSFIVDSSGNPIIGCMTGGGLPTSYYPAAVYRYSAGKWDTVGALKTTPSDAFYPSLSITNSGLVYMAYANSQAEGGDIFVRAYNAGVPPPSGITNINSSISDRIAVIPTPCHNTCTITGIEPNTVVTIFDVTGRLFSSFIFKNNLISTSTWPVGTYIIHTSQGGSAKLIKQ